MSERFGIRMKVLGKTRRQINRNRRFFSGGSSLDLSR